MPIALTSAQKRYLRGLAHDLKPVILVGGKGVTDGLVAETASALQIHELIKVKVAAEDREARDLAIATLADAADAALIARIGNIAVMFKPRTDKPLIALPR
ncbi:ribosome assembly RNA-binding protein YhbY [Silanimonas sp.]|jgi:RNA-binding protein|uniref:ribosome assembly RNA-binding protein YhbY n=1 Tax=Silanimonas sp. TaxID=1929290 RepID=UPI0022C7D766|nr:ribosome assembly RNA-binding protein YhbY [Silanimonas sp.]MCZ8063545.1 ribosome assembly RNA-binding protein YhbY [Silanimonas sp.]MCZ8114906.1 ribosome assembly RNA-binding protein YhbY [Silanimonas sp.]